MERLALQKSWRSPEGVDTLGCVRTRKNPPQQETARGDVQVDRRRVELNVTGLADYLLAKMAAARERRLPKDWYDIAFVLRHNDDGGPGAAARAIRQRFPEVFAGSMRTSLLDLQANLLDTDAQGSNARASKMRESDPSMELDMLRADAVVAVEVFVRGLTREVDL